MQKIFITLLLMTVINPLLSHAQKLPKEKQVMQTLRRANQYFMDKWPDAGKETVTNKVRPSNLWTRAVYYEGLVGLYQVDPQQTYKDYMMQWGEKHQWGLWGGATVRNADNQCCAQTYIDLYLMDGSKHPERISTITTAIDNMQGTSKIDDWHWIDALQMAMPVFVKLGNI
jgi:rhamnogalacturonyl hydrolase YesR